MNRSTRRALRKGKGDMARVLAGIFTGIGEEMDDRSALLSKGDAAQGALELYRAGYLELVAEHGRVGVRLSSPPSPTPIDAATLAEVAELLSPVRH